MQVCPEPRCPPSTLLLTIQALVVLVFASAKSPAFFLPPSPGSNNYELSNCFVPSFLQAGGTLGLQLSPWPPTFPSHSPLLPLESLEGEGVG